MAKTLESYPWSSHRGYVSGDNKWHWLHKKFILSMFSLNEGDGLKAYCRFVSLESEEKLRGILEGKKWPSLLGSEGFIHWIKEKFYSGKMNDEIPQSRELAPEVDHIKMVVSRFYGIDQEELLHSRRGVFNEPRNIAIYLTRCLRGDSLRRMGEDFEIEKYSSVSSIIEKTKRRMAEDRKLRVRIEKFLSQLNKSQGQT